MHALEELNWQKIGLGVTKHSSMLTNGMPASYLSPLEVTDCMGTYLCEEEVVF
jgi:hypothetical protein